MTADASQSSILIGATILAGVLGVLSRSFLTNFREWSDAKRRMAVERDDADIAERDRKIAYLQGVADERLRELEARDRLVWAHQRWDRAKMSDPCGDHGDPPPLFPDPERPPTN